MVKFCLRGTDCTTDSAIADRPAPQFGSNGGDKCIPISRAQGAGSVEDSEKLTIGNGDRRHGKRTPSVSCCAVIRAARLSMCFRWVKFWRKPSHPARGGFLYCRNRNACLPWRHTYELQPVIAATIPYPIRARTSKTGTCNGATPIAIASAIKPSIRPTERFLEGLRLPASSSAITVLAMHMLSTG
jgi:hypothetical protein